MGCGNSTQSGNPSNNVVFFNQSKQQKQDVNSIDNSINNNEIHSNVVISFDTLKREDDVSSTLVCQLLSSDTSFENLSVSEGEGIKRRDSEDDVKLAVGLHYSIEKGIISAEHGAKSATPINVEGKSAAKVAAEIVAALPPQSTADKNDKKGNVIVLVGLSGTGKGTTVLKLKSMLPRVMTWSNGNVFRSLTHLIAADLGKTVLSQEDITTDIVKKAIERLTFKRCSVQTAKTSEEATDTNDDTVFDIFIDRNVRVSEIQNTILKTTVISANVPTVAEATQGEVIIFAQNAVETLQNHGFNVILEGRAQTLNYISTESRFELVMSEAKLLGQRRAAQRVVAQALAMLTAASSTSGIVPSDSEVAAAVAAAAKTLIVNP